MNLGPLTLLRGRFNIHLNNMSFPRFNVQLWWPTHKECSLIGQCSIGERGNTRRETQCKGLDKHKNLMHQILV